MRLVEFDFEIDAKKSGRPAMELEQKISTEELLQRILILQDRL